MRRTAALLLVAACSFPSPRATDDAGPDDDAPPDTAPGVWWDRAWSARMRIHIDNRMVSLDQGFQIGLRRDLDLAPCDGPPSAIRVVRNHTTEVPRVIDTNLAGADEWIWFRLAAPAASTIGPSEYWLYCGNPAAGPALADPKMVFDLHEEFDGTSLPAGWLSQGPGLVMVGNGVVTLAGNNASIHSAAAYGAGTAVDFMLQASNNARNDPGFWGGLEVGFTTVTPWVVWYADAAGVITQWIHAVGNEPPMNGRAFDSALHLYGVENYGTAAGFRHTNAAVGLIQYGVPITQQMNVRFHNYQSGGPIQLAMARVRKAVNPIPDVTLGAVENRP
jgi:hypothetical protein